MANLMSTLLDAFRIERHAERMRDSFWYFTDRMFLRHIPNRKPGRHQRIICDAVQKLADDPEGGVLILLVPPGGAKSLICARSLPAWIFGREPRARILAITNTMPLVESHGRAIRECLTTSAYQSAFEVGLSTSSAAVAAFATTGGGEFFGVGSAGAALGRRADWIIIDDPVASIEEANSVSQMGKLHEAWSNNILTRAMPGTRIVLIQQRLSVNDLAGHILAHPVKGGYKVTLVRMPMLCDDPANDPLGRAEGEPLWPEYWTPQMLAQAQADSVKWKTLYMQRPASADAEWFTAEDLRPDTAPTLAELDDRAKWSVLMGIDLAYSKNAGDETVFAVVAFERRTGKMHVVDVYANQVEDHQSVEDLLVWITKYKPDWIGVDRDLASVQWVGHMKVRAMSEGVGVSNLEVMSMTTAAGNSKGARALSLKLKAKAGLLHIDYSKHWAPKMIEQLLAFPMALGSAVDDHVDALAITARKVSNMVVQNHTAPERKLLPTRQQMTLDDLHADREATMGPYTRL